ncbi:hypothetical protein H4R21_001474 [Coemansia helicoidea]|uniref:Uncharacterized protein n=1 Tax=Coemansia helicoidea TaxID=1286919 RepID=A0ACC1LCQ2_9FUNG|nr:hypothetical protein H4R21_001474 [Coemansia helicoidea]
MSASSRSGSRSGSPSAPPMAGVETWRFSAEPLLLRLDVATHAFYQGLAAGSSDRKMMEVVANAANVNVLTRPAGKKEFKKYNKPNEDETTRDVRLKYQLRENNLRQAGTFDPQWGVRWLLSYVVLTEIPGISAADAARLTDLVEQWLDALAAAEIHEIASELPGMKATIAVARSELVCLRELGDRLPGRFNCACSLLFGGALRSTYVDACLPRWVLSLRARDGAASSGAQQGIPEGCAPLTIADAQACVAGIVAPGAACTSSGAVDLRVKAIGAAADDSGLVQVRVRTFDRESDADKGAEDVVLRFEPDVAAELRVGFVIEATLYALDGGIHYIDNVTMVWPSYSVFYAEFAQA